MFVLKTSTFTLHTYVAILIQVVMHIVPSVCLKVDVYVRACVSMCMCGHMCMAWMSCVLCV